MVDALRRMPTALEEGVANFSTLYPSLVGVIHSEFFQPRCFLRRKSKNPASLGDGVFEWGA